jgi:hypothetical protein
MSLFEQKVNEIREALMGTNTSTEVISPSTDPEVKRAKDQLKNATIRAKEKELASLKSQPSA